MPLPAATAIALVLLLAACEQAPSAPRVTVEDAVVRLPPVPGRPGAAYFVLRTGSDPIRLLALSSPRAERIELHESRMSNGVSRMDPAGDLAFTGTLAFRPGGKHAMLFGLDPALKPGDPLPLTFAFAPAPSVTVTARVEGVGGGNSGH